MLQKWPILIACNALGFNAEWVFPQIHSPNLRNAAYYIGRKVGRKLAPLHVEFIVTVASQDSDGR